MSYLKVLRLPSLAQRRRALQTYAASGALIVFALVVLVACGQSTAECALDSECPGDQSCVAQMCELRCDDDSVCEEGERCGVEGVCEVTPVAAPRPKLDHVGRALGPISKGKVELFAISNLEVALDEATTSSGGFSRAGAFDLNLSGVSDDELYLIRVSGGRSHDKDHDGHSDKAASSDAVIHAVAWGSELRAGGVRVNLLTELSWVLSNSLVGEIDAAGLRIRLDEIARTLISLDIDGDELIDARDALAFEPGLDEGRLSFSYAELKRKLPVGDTKESVLGAYLAGDEPLLTSVASKLFLVTASPFPGQYSVKNRIRVSLFGHGRVKASRDTLSLDSKSLVEYATDYFDAGEDNIELTAVPAEGSKIIGWNGCQRVSDDLKRCTVSPAARTDVRAAFGYKEVKIAGGLVDLSHATLSIEEDRVAVRVAHGDHKLAMALRALKPGDHIVSAEGTGLLRRVTALERDTDFRYSIATEDAVLADVLKQGSTYVQRQLQAGDLRPAEPSTDPGGSQRRVLGASPQIQVLPQRGPDDDVIRLRLGDVSSESAPGGSAPGLKTGDLKLEYKGKKRPTTLTLSGSAELRIGVEAGLSMSLKNGLEEFLLVPSIEVEENFKVVVSGGIETDADKARKLLKTFIIGNVTTFIGPLPVVLTFNLDVYTNGQAKLGAAVTFATEFKQTAKIGISYKQGRGWEGVRDGSTTLDFKRPRVSATGELSGGFEFGLSALLYGQIGPRIPVTALLKLESKFLEVEAGLDGLTACTSIALSFGLGTELEWQWTSNKLAKLLDLQGETKFKVELKYYEKSLGKWQYPTRGCAVAEPLLSVTGENVSETVFANESTQEYSVGNIGGKELEWKVTFAAPKTTVRVDGREISSGEVQKLKGGRSVRVEVVVDTSSLNNSSYENQFRFDGLNDPTPVAPVTRTINLFGVPELSPPTNLEARLDSPNLAELTWEYDGVSGPLVEGYHVEQAGPFEDGPAPADSEYQEADPGILSGLIQTTVSLKDLPVGGYWFRVRAFNGDDSSEWSEPVKLTVKAIAPTEGCQAHFSGGVISDYASVEPRVSQAQSPDRFSEHVGPGDHPSAKQAFPKAAGSTFDGIALSEGTRVTIYAEPEFKGGIVWQGNGPIILNNKRWAGEEWAARVMNGEPNEAGKAEWQEPLHSLYPRRDWSTEDMHSWSQGSLIVECTNAQAP